jgi:lipoprotein-anchoring transpeptidase ErfK/SrfK
LDVPSLTFTGERIPSLALTGEKARRSPRGALVVLAVAVPLVPIAAGIVLTAGASVKPAQPALLLSPLDSPIVSVAPPELRRAVKHAPLALVARVHTQTTMRVSPGGRVLATQPTVTQYGSPAVVLVRRQVPGWLGVVSPLAGNGRLGWIPAASASLSRVSWQLDVSLSKRELTVLDRGVVIERYKIAVGATYAPTPTGEFAVTDRLHTGDPSGPYGCCILALSALAPHAIQGWDGGNRIAIHSTPEISSIGHPVSHGCMRLTVAEGAWLISHIPEGTPTIIRT